MPHPAPQGREPSGSDRHYPKSEPGLPDYCYHESRQPCGIPPPRGASPRDATGITPSRNQGSLITAITNPGNHAASRPTGARALGKRQTLPQAGTRAPELLLSRIPGNHAPSRPTRGASPRETTDINPSRNQGSRITASTNPGNHAASRPKGARALGKRQTLPQDGTRAPELVLSRIQATMRHPALRGASPRDATGIAPSRTQGSLITAITDPRNHAASRPTGARALGKR